MAPSAERSMFGAEFRILPRNSGALAAEEVVHSCCDSEEDTKQNSTNLSDDQQRAVDLARCGHNVFITGPAGSGKSYVVKRIYQNLTSTTEKSVQIVCPTGAACSIYDDLPRKSETVHSYFGVGLAEQPITAIVNSTKEYISKKLNQVDVIILDEVSMLSARLFNLITLIAQRCRDNDKPFGGIQVVAVGDFYQLPPVPGFVDPGEYAFISPFWKFTFKHHVLLTTIYRQHSQTHLLNALNLVRIGQYDAATIDFLNTLKRPLTNQDSATHIYFNNLDVDYHNMCCLDRLPGQCSVFHSIDQGELREIERRCLAPKTLIIKEGAPVMLLYNLSKELHNGCIGTYNCVDVSGNPVVTFHDKYIHCAIPQRTWTYKDDHGREIARRCQYPLKLCWAITSHKSQGQTLQNVVIHAGTEFVCGQLYVALSRGKSTETIQLSGFHAERMLPVSKQVLTFYNSLTTSTEEVHEGLTCCKDICCKIPQTFEERVKPIEDSSREETFIQSMFEKDDSDEEMVDLTDVYGRMDKSGSELENLPDDFCVTSFLSEIVDTSPLANVECSLSWQINALIDQLMKEPEILRLFLSIQWLKIYSATKKTIEQSHITKVKRTEFTSMAGNLHALANAPSLREEGACLFKLHISQMKVQHFTFLTSVVWNIHDTQMKILAASVNTSSEEDTCMREIIDVDEMGSDGKGKIRYVAGWTIKKELEGSRKYVKTYLSSADKKVRARIKEEYQCAQALDSLTVPESILHRDTVFPDTLTVTDSRQYTKHGLIHVKDKVYLFFLKLEQARLVLLTTKKLDQQSELLIENTKRKLSDNSELYATFQELYSSNQDNTVNSETIKTLYARVVSRYVNVCAGQFLKDYRRDSQLKKTQAHRKKIASKNEKKRKAAAKVT
ncbi:uncharacterized protein [Ptychodera flava]|uniref:uncharacterized protein n=1 Tax=Ptychodera flava TaxID=63121 RepID=UPI00396A4580